MRTRRIKQILRRNPFPHRRTLGFFYGEKMRAIASILPQEEHRSVLEVGGGASGLTSLFFPRARVVNVDPDPPARERQRQAATRTQLVPGVATRLPFASSVFDCVTLFDVLEHVPDDQMAAAEAMRVLRPGGSVLVSCPSREWRYPYYRSGFPNICSSEVGIMAEWGHVRRGYSREDIPRLFSGCESVAASSYINPLTVIAHDIAFSKLDERLKIALILLQYPVTLFGYVVGWPGPRMGLAFTLRKAGQRSPHKVEVAA